MAPTDASSIRGQPRFSMLGRLGAGFVALSLLPSACSNESSHDRSCNPSRAIAQWPLKEQLGQLLLVGAEPHDGEYVLSHFPVGGIFINANTTGQLSTAGGIGSSSATKVPPIVAIDEEGGRIQRIPDLVGTIPSARAMATTMTTDEVRELAFDHGQAMRGYGITMDFAPVVDVSEQPADAIIGDRSFSNEPDVVIEYAGAFADGLRQAGVTPVFKHFPGHGHAQGDSHREVATTPPLSSLESSDLLPYEELLGVGTEAVMVGHLDVPGLSSAAEPTSVNRAAIDGLLRDGLGYQGLVITDDLASMVAITTNYSLMDATLAALQAGADMVVWKYNDQVPAVLDRLARAVESGELDEAAINRSVRRVLAVKGVDPCTS
jgi:beta-N-acetylhexosaminidase